MGRKPERAAKSVAQVDGGPQRRERPSLRARPHRIREFHEGAPKQAARRVFVKVGHERNCGPADCAYFLRERRVRRLTHARGRHASCRIYENSNLTLLRKE